jgi:hypothetical protein
MHEKDRKRETKKATKFHNQNRDAAYESHLTVDRYMTERHSCVGGSIPFIARQMQRGMAYASITGVLVVLHRIGDSFQDYF